MEAAVAAVEVAVAAPGEVVAGGGGGAGRTARRRPDSCRLMATGCACLEMRTEPPRRPLQPMQPQQQLLQIRNAGWEWYPLKEAISPGLQSTEILATCSS